MEPASASGEPSTEQAIATDPPSPESHAEPAGIIRQGVSIGEFRLLFEFAATSRLSELVPITPVPAAPHGLAGLASLHGSVLPVFDLMALAALTRATPARRQLLLVVGRGDSAAAILIDGLPERLRLTENDRRDGVDSPEWLSDCILGAYARGEEIWFDVNHSQLLSRLEECLRTPA